MPQLTGGKAGTYGGNLYVVNAVQLDSVYIAGGKAKTTGADVYLYTGSKLAVTLGDKLSGDIQMAVAAALLGEGTYGQPVTGVTAGAFPAKITMENVTGQPKALSVDGELVVAGATVVNAEGKETWFVDNAAAVAACDKNEYVKLYTDDELVLTKDLTVDLNGRTVAVSGNYSLSGMDSTGDGYAEPAGKATVAGQTEAVTYSPDHKIYLSVTDGSNVTFHRLGMELTDIALRPDDAGIYYQGSWSCDDTLKAKIAEYGIVTSLAQMPTVDFRNDETCMAASFTDTIANGTKKAGVLVKNIMKTGNEKEQNTANGEKPIYATAYVTLTDGTIVTSNAPGATDDVSYSLYTYMEQLDNMISMDPTNYRKFEKTVKEFYAAWEDKGTGAWRFNRLKAPEDPADDGILNILLVGHSGTYYYVEELYQLLKEAGIESRICNLYYSGCYLQWHWN